MKSKFLRLAILSASILTVGISVAVLYVGNRHTPKRNIPARESTALGAPHTRQALLKMPLHFIENRGQADERVAFYVQGSDTSVYFTSQGITFALSDTAAAGADSKQQQNPRFENASFEAAGASEAETVRRRWALKLDFVGANPNVRPRGEQETGAKVSYFKGPKDQWKTGLKTFSRIVYPDLWPGIDLVYSGSFDKLKYEFIVRPGADPAQIKLAYHGATHVAVKETGQIAVETPAGGFTDERPVSYQESDGQQVEVATAFNLESEENKQSELSTPHLASTQYGFRVAEYDRTKTLVIDPVTLVYCGFIGGSGSESANDIAVDGAGNVYVTGRTNSTEATFPVTAGPDLIHNTGDDAFVVKVRAVPTEGASPLVYAGYIGGSGVDQGNDIAIDGAGNAYVVGETTSTEATFPVAVGPDLSHNGGTDAFVAKVDATGTSLVYAGYIGGTGADTGNAGKVDNTGNFYVTGQATSIETTFPVAVGPDLSHNGGTDAFVAKVKADPVHGMSPLEYCGYVGGTSSDQGFNIAIDSAGNAYVTGQTVSTETQGFPVVVGPDLTHNSPFFPGSFGGTPAQSDAFVAKVKPTPVDGNSPLEYCGYVGGRGRDLGQGIAIDAAGNAYLTGVTDDGSFTSIVGPDTGHNFGEDAFVTKVKPVPTAGNSPLAYSGFIGGSGNETGFDIAVDGKGNAYITGVTTSTQTTFPVTVGPDVTHNGAQDAFIVRVSGGGATFSYSGYIGGSAGDGGNGITIDAAGNAYISGFVSSTQTSFPVTVGPDLMQNGGQDAFVTKVFSDVVNFTVNSVSDGSDSNLADGACDDGTGFCTLRAAIEQANANASAETALIDFALPGTGIPIISVGSSGLGVLPVINVPVKIFGGGQIAAIIGAVELNGSMAGGGDGLHLSGGASEVSSLIVTAFGGNGIRLSGLGTNLIQGCTIKDNGANGVLVENVSNNIIRAVTNSNGINQNSITGNGSNGVEISGVAATGNVVHGSRIGTSFVNGNEVDAGNAGNGVLINGAPGNTIGGTTFSAVNQISGNDTNGVEIRGGAATGNTVRGNLIGTGFDSRSALKNTAHGVLITENAGGNIIGGIASGEENTIAFNGGDGIFVESGSANNLRGNLLHSNAGMGIDLAPDGVTANDSPDDADTGPNNLQNFPVIASATTNGSTTTVTGTLNSTASTTFTLEFFRNVNCDDSGSGEGQTLLGSTTVTTDASSNASFSIPFPGNLFNQIITVAATDPAGNTSEFSPCAVVTGTPIFVVTNTNDSGPGSLRQAILGANADPGPENITFQIGTGLQTINVGGSGLGALPTITGQVNIDGTTQPGYVGVPLIELNGAGAGSTASGLSFSAGANTVKGLVINRFGGSGIALPFSQGNNVIQGNYIGTDASGTVDLGNREGVRISTSFSNVIGGTTPAARNIISGNAVAMSSARSTSGGSGGNVIQGNYIGTDVTGNADLGNDRGIEVGFCE